MRRFVTLLVLLLSSVPFGVSVSGCAHNLAPTFCNGGDSGPTTTQAATITMQPLVYGISLNYAEIGQLQTPSTTDCKGSYVSVLAYTYATTDMTIADVQPTSGRLCGGTWNRNSGGGIPDYTYCIPTNKSGTAYLTASADGVTSNPIPVFIHPVITSIVLGSPSIAGAASITAWSIVNDTATVSAWSIVNNTITFTAQNSFSANQTVSLSHFPISTFFNGITNAMVQAGGLSSTQFTVVIPGFTHANGSATETGLAVVNNSNVVTFTAQNSYSAGQLLALSNFPNSTFFDGITDAQVLAANSSQFSVTIPGFTQPNGSATETGLALGPGCSTNPSTDCCPLGVNPVTAPAYQANSCISQGSTAQLVSRVFAGTGSNQTNISCLAGHLQYTVQGASSSVAVSPVVSIDQNGVATANQPGSVLISANLADAASSAGLFSTCPPASITLSPAGVTGNPVVVNQNNPQPLLATVLDTKGAPLTGLPLEYVSTAPSTIPAGSTVTPPLAGAASITAVCQPPNCNSASYNQIGLFGNGLPVTSNSVNITAPGTNSTVLYMASTQSLDVVQIDYTTSVLGQPYQLPFVPNSMLISTDGSTIYMGSSTALMVLNAVNTLSLSRADTSSPGTVLALSPNGNTLVISDPVHQVISIESSSGSVISSYGGVATHAEFSPDSQTVYIAAGDQLLVYSAYTGWTNITVGTPVSDVAITVPSVGAYFAGPTTTARGYCPISTPTTVNGVTTETNVFYPLDVSTQSALNTQTVATDRIAATNDGKHILGATASPAKLNDLLVTVPIGACPATGGLSFPSTLLTPSVSLNPPTGTLTATAITGVLPTSDSTVAFITYTGSGGVLPAYAPAASGLGQTTYIKLSGTATAPIAGVISADNATIYAATSGDNLVHLITRSTLTDTSTLAPNLLAAPNQSVPVGTVVPVNLLVQKPRKTT